MVQFDFAQAHLVSKLSVQSYYYGEIAAYIHMIFMSMFVYNLSASVTGARNLERP